ncbi:hypothetical protein NDU88_005086 [Pleurodeles waltl]|uniref:Uncharacterized protein n=1 Tax=Pleurodeles waltl TaxID=8319 RepID=A0AAV7VI01_PLEWA|nr:hypothetical protein NDU88_005086 [Pleurodeles waltl]
MPVEILTFEKMVLKDIESLSTKRSYVKFNLTYDENIGLKDLREKHDIVIKAAVKGGGIVSQDIKDYQHEILRQLSDKNCYKEINADPTKQLRAEILELTTRGLDLGHDKVSRALCVISTNIGYMGPARIPLQACDAHERSGPDGEPSLHGPSAFSGIIPLPFDNGRLYTVIGSPMDQSLN